MAAEVRIKEEGAIHTPPLPPRTHLAHMQGMGGEGGGGGPATIKEEGTATAPATAGLSRNILEMVTKLGKQLDDIETKYTREIHDLKIEVNKLTIWKAEVEEEQQR